MTSIVEPDQRPAAPETLHPSSGTATRRLDSSWVWMGLACVLIGASGLVRIYQDQQIGLARSSTEPCPFPLVEIPTKIGAWVSVPNPAVKLDDETVRITGSTDHILRTYSDELTGVTLSVLILYGPAESVVPHTPEVCYPASGFDKQASAPDYHLPLVGHDARFRVSTYYRSGGGITERALVYHAFRLDGDWSPDIASGRKFHRINPGVFKVQIQRLVGVRERSTQNEPVESFLATLVPEMERMIAEATSQPSQSASQ